MKTLVFLCLAAIPAMALAAHGGDKQDKKADALICRDSPETGSRLSSKRICMTREAWEASRRDARQAIDQAQIQQTNPCGAATKC